MTAGRPCGCAIVERYGGLYSFSVKEGKFVLRVSL